MELRFDIHRNGKEFFELSAGESYCDPKYCDICEANESHKWDDLEELGVESMTYTAPDGSVWYGEQFSHDESPSFGWWETRYRFWKQNFQADETKKRIRQVRDAINKLKDRDRLEQIAAILGV